MLVSSKLKKLISKPAKSTTVYKKLTVFANSARNNLFVQSHQLVHRSDAYCHGHILDKWVCFCVFYCTELYGEQQVLVAQSGLTLCNPMNCSPPGSTVHEIFSSKGTGVHCRFLLQGIFATRGLNMGLLHCRQILCHLSLQGSPNQSSRIGFMPKNLLKLVSD